MYKKTEKEKIRARAYAKKWRQKHKSANGLELTRNEYRKGGKHYVYTMWMRAKVRAKRDNLPFNIEPDDIVIPELCPIFNCPLQIAAIPNRKGPADWSPSLDKIDPTLGYVKGNICVISFKANRLKNNNTVETLRLFLSYMDNHK